MHMSKRKGYPPSDQNFLVPVASSMVLASGVAPRVREKAKWGGFMRDYGLYKSGIIGFSKSERKWIFGVTLYL